MMAAVRFIQSMFMKLMTLFFRVVEHIGASRRRFRIARFESLPDGYAISQVGTEHYLVSTSDKVIGRSLYVRGEFDFGKFTDAWKLAGLEGAKEAVTLVDIGANVGSIGIPAVKRGYAVRCVAFEPEPLNAKLLKTNVILNDLEERFDLFQVALGDREGEILFELSDSNFGDHRVRLNEPGEGRYDEQSRKTISVPMKTLDDYADRIGNGPCLLWMDTQGFEGHVLQGASRLLQQKIPMVLEFWPYGLKRNDGFELLLKSLANSKYEYFINLDSTDKNKIPLSAESLNILCSELEEGDEFTDILVL